MSYNAHHTPGGHMQWGLLAPATVILGGAGLLFLAGAQEIGQNVGYGWQAGLAVAGGAAVLLLLALLYLPLQRSVLEAVEQGAVNARISTAEAVRQIIRDYVEGQLLRNHVRGSRHG
ncbi:hypothetical protein [Stenotrophomonas sp. TD3]|uniref:hypothetical protein n=1 Tax=Stenotrophomonas sp. TD3 TaxID=1641707 RepID=UPI000AD4A91D|nr:hypothetical protein [Stenotrophomonas sp. TD3]